MIPFFMSEKVVIELYFIKTARSQTMNKILDFFCKFSSFLRYILLAAVLFFCGFPQAGVKPELPG